MTLMQLCIALCRAVDPHSFFADPDPAVFCNADPDPAAVFVKFFLKKSFITERFL